MAIAPKDVYPGQVATADANYPQGKAQNVISEGDGIGTPFEKTWLNDVWGFLQSILSTAAVAPNGSPDSISNKQYMDAIRGLTRKPWARYSIEGVSIPTGGNFEFSSEFESHASDDQFTLVDSGGAPATPGTEIKPAISGTHAIWCSGVMNSALATNPAVPILRLKAGPFTHDFSGARWSTNTAHLIPFATCWLVNLDTLGVYLELENQSGADLTIGAGAHAKLVITRVTGPNLGW